MSAIFKREIKSYFTSPIGYVVIAIVAFISSFFFAFVYTSGYADLSEPFFVVFIATLIVVPILTMRLFSEEKRQKTDQLLLTAPIGLISIVMGKFLAAFTVFSVSLSVFVIYQIILSAYASPDLLLFLGNLLGLLLVAAALISVGIFISSLMESQVVAAIVSIAITVVLILMNFLGSLLKSAAVDKVVEWIAFQSRYATFTQGRFSYANFLFFIGVTAIFLFLTSRVLEKKRWA